MSPDNPSEQGWQLLGTVPESELVAAREDAHWAMQVLSAVGYTHVDLAGDDSQSNAGWVDGMQILAGRRIEKEPVCFVSLAPAGLTLALHEPGGEVLEEFACRGHSLEEARSWVASAIAKRQGGDPVELRRPGYVMPAHPVAEGAALGSGSPGGLEEFARWLHNANLVMLDLRRMHPRATVPRVWPHHFDMGMLITLDESNDRSIGIGLSPGDESSAEPYWYVNPYPAPEGDLPNSKVGRWNEEGWTGLTLTATDILAASREDAAVQEELTRRFLDESVKTCCQLLEG